MRGLIRASRGQLGGVRSRSSGPHDNRQSWIIAEGTTTRPSYNMSMDLRDLGQPVFSRGAQRPGTANLYVSLNERAER